MGSILSVIIELTVVILLGVTVAYCIILDRRLQRLRADETSMRQTVVDLGLSTERAERAIEALRTSFADCEKTLGDRLRAAQETSESLQETIRSGDEVLDRIGRVVASARKAVDDLDQRPRAVAPAASKVSETLAAAEAFAERARRRILDNAA
jgi:SMC interacting uncharacterized protein involved in chromosome segregation